EDAASVDAIARQRVTVEFAGCLGDKPTDDQLHAGTVELQKNVAYDAAAYLVPRKLDDFFKTGGGPAAYGVSSELRKNML
ncbi:hypothetical protein ABTJ92_22430, partial [Acinetobacter baumannii]